MIPSSLLTKRHSEAKGRGISALEILRLRLRMTLCQQTASKWLGGLSIAFLVLCESGSAMAESSLTEAIARLETTYQWMQDFQANFEQVEKNKLFNREKKSSGVIYSLPQGKIFWHTREPTEFKVISDGKKIWLYYPDHLHLFEESWGKLDSQTKLALLFLRREGDLKKHFRIRWQDKKNNLIALLPRKAIGVEKIWLELSSHEVEGRPAITFFKKLIFFFPLERMTELLLTSVTFNQQLWQKHQISSLDENINRDFGFYEKE